MPRFGRLFFINISVFCLYGILEALFLSFPDFRPIRYAASSASLSAVFLLSALNLTALLEKGCGRKFDWLERANIGALFALLFVPFLLSFEFTVFGILFPFLPLLNSLVLFLLAIFFHPSFAEDVKATLLPRGFFGSLGSAVVIYLILIGCIVFAYYPLPDLDPYYWLSKYRAELLQHGITLLQLNRPLFSSLIYSFNQSASIDLYASFKYILPFISLTTVLPAALLARFRKTWYERLVIFLIPLSGASTILYLTLPIPQALLNTLAVFFVIFLLYARAAKDDAFFFLAGGIVFFGYFYHEAAALFLVVWLFVFFITYHGTLRAAMGRNKLATFFFLLLVTSYASAILFPIFHFFLSWENKLWMLFPSFHMNLSFPGTYINIDGNAVGWGSGLGILKYYAYYAGPALLLILSAGAVALRKRPERITALRSAEYLTLVLSFTLFFSIAEILPRFFNIALLPERAWGTVGLLLLSLVPWLLDSLPGRRKILFSILFIAAIGANIGAAVYINSLKRYLITPQQVASAEWINGSLPHDRLIFTHEHENLLRIHSESEIVSVASPDFYSDIRVFDKRLRIYRSDQSMVQKEFHDYLAEVARYLSQMKSQDVGENRAAILERLDQLVKSTERMEGALQESRVSETISVQPLYIYYAKGSERNPYADRPYAQANAEDNITSFAFDNYPDRFQRVYALPDDEVVIWRVLP